MNINLIPTGDNPPENINVVIEVPVGGEPVKYEFDKKSGALFVDRILHTPMRYPANYGFVPHTLSPDGDPIDALVIARTPFVPIVAVQCRARRRARSATTPPALRVRIRLILHPFGRAKYTTGQMAKNLSWLMANG